MGRNVRAEESRAEMVLGRGVPEPFSDRYSGIPSADRWVFVESQALEVLFGLNIIRFTAV